ncbi:MAG: hypothetical protein BroJett003_01570 [Planctomycetota bacterium]|nr:MAG: hypothetical protein BroJett003_01570 [Planctomycetota bacterium]
MELTVGLVVIGLLAGMILVGRELLESATMHRAVSQVGRVQTGISLFRAKYSAFPGDFAKASQYWPGQGIIDGDGDERIGGGYLSDVSAVADGSLECYNAWNHLAATGVLEWHAEPVSAPPTAAQTVAMPGVLDRSYLGLHHDGATYGYGVESNYITLTRLALGTTRESFRGIVYGMLTLPGVSDVGLRPAVAARFDAKADDGQPLTGAVTAAYPGGACSDASANTYLYAQTRNSCGLWIAFSAAQ